jgi:hypothetical protein
MKRARKRTLQEDLRRYCERLRAPHMRDGKLVPLEERYQNGDKTVILKELVFCLINAEAEAIRAGDASDSDIIPFSMPKWLYRALFRAIARAFCIETDSWDDVFGPPVLTKDGRPARGKTRLALRRKAELQFAIYHRVKQSEARGKTIDKGLFEHIAKDFGIGRAMAEKIYYDDRVLIELITSRKDFRRQPLRE